MIQGDEQLEAYRFTIDSVTYWCALVQNSDSDHALCGVGGVPRVWSRREMIPLDISRLTEGHESTEVDLDALCLNTEYWLQHDGDAVITAWNFLDDFVPFTRQPWGFKGGKTLERCYDKLFWSLNISWMYPAYPPEHTGRHSPQDTYVATWSDREIRKIHQLLNAGRRRIQTFLADFGY